MSMTATTPMAIASRLKQLREAAGLSQHELAARAGLQTAHVAKLEQGVMTDPRWSTIRGLCRALGVLPHQLDDEPIEALPGLPGGGDAPSPAHPEKPRGRPRGRPRKKS